MLKKIKKFHKQNLKSLANNMQLDSEETQQSDFSSYLMSKVNSFVKYPVVILLFVFIVFNTARIDPFCNKKPDRMSRSFWNVKYSFEVNASSI